MRPRSASTDNKSIRTFFIYAGVVLFFILVSLAIKTIFLIQQSKFDGEHQFILAVSQDEKVKEFILFYPIERSVTVLKLKGSDLNQSRIGQAIGIIPDAKVNASFPIPLSNSAETMRIVAWRYNAVKTDLTIFDAVRLFLLAQKASLHKESIKEIEIAKGLMKNEKSVANLFIDDTLFSENISIQIINASGTPGIGKRLERTLTNLGGNIVAVSTSRKEERLSKIQYFGKETYTLNKLKKLLGFPTELTDKESIATIVITIGEDNKNSSGF